MKRLAALAAIVFALAANALPARAAQFVQDGASMFSPGTVSQLNTQIGTFNAQTGKEIVVVTVPSLNGETVQNAAQTVFSEQRINGVLIFIAKNERKDIIVPGRATAQFFPASTTTQIRQQMESSFRNGDFDGGITTAVNSVLDVFRAHLNSAPGNANAGRNYPAPVNQRPVATQSGVHLSVFWWIILIVIGFLVIRSIFRAMSGPRYYGGPGGGPVGGPGYGPGPGYGGYGGPGYYGGGGGGFWSGLLGGLGGAWLGNELFNRGGGGGYVDPNVAGTGVAPVDQGGGWGGGADAGGWGNDAGQADMGSSSAGDWGGGGFGGGDFGGGGDSGGGGGDSGGGW